MGFRRIFADDGRDDKEKLYKELSDKVDAREVLKWADGNVERYEYNNNIIITSDYLEWLRKNDVCKQELKNRISDEINKLRKNITDKDELTKTVVNTISNTNKGDVLLSVYSRLYAILYGKEAYKSILKTALRGNPDKNIQKLLEAIQNLNKSETLEGIKEQLQNIQEIVSKIPDKNIKSLMKEKKEGKGGEEKKSFLVRTAADYKTIGKALVNGLVRATMNVLRVKEDISDNGLSEEEREGLLHSIYSKAGEYLSNSVLKSYKTVLDNTLKQWNQNLSEKNEISKDESLRDYSIIMLIRIGVLNVENYGLWMLHAAEQFYKERGMSVLRVLPRGLKDYLNEQWKSRYSEDFKDIVANEAIRLLNEDYASNEDFANEWDGYKANRNQGKLAECIDSYVDDAYDSLGSQRMDEYYFGKKFKRLDGENGKNIKNELLKEVKEELTNSVLNS